MFINKVFINFFACFFLGYSLGYFNNNLSSKFSKPLILYGVPLIVVGTLLDRGVDEKLFFSLNFGLLYVFLQISFIFLVKSAERQKFNTLLTSIIGNTGYIGLPISILFLEKDYLIYAVGFDIGAMLVTWGFIPILFGIKNKTKKIFFEKKFILDIIFNSPGIRGLLLYFIISNLLNYEIINKSIDFASSIISFCSLIFVGICVGELAKKYEYKFIYKNLKPVLITYKLILSPILMKILCKILDIDDNASRAFIVQSAMPTAVSIMLLSEYFNYDQRDVAAMIVGTSLLSLISLPTVNLILLN